ncbi:uncharacterized protein LOC113566196 [Drosophila persimilis]|uniref:uncharacterized protein LOC113566196 n=1 Tax=Drosophila persimilis TaxID=7234 RepID=UPI000F08EEDC|nr:uncharacterized protein LOC113566196 [Drosophila persimilis]
MVEIHGLFNSLLVVSCGCALYTFDPVRTPYAYGAAVLCLFHGLLGVLRAAFNADDDCNRLSVISAGVMEIAPLNLVSIELHLKSSHPTLAVAHSYFMVPLALDMMAKMSGTKDVFTDKLKQLTVLANLASLLYLAIDSSNNIYEASYGLCCPLDTRGPLERSALGQGQGQGRPLAPKPKRVIRRNDRKYQCNSITVTLLWQQPQ